LNLIDYYRFLRFPFVAFVVTFADQNPLCNQSPGPPSTLGGSAPVAAVARPAAAFVGAPQLMVMGDDQVMASSSLSQ